MNSELKVYIEKWKCATSNEYENIIDDFYQDLKEKIANKKCWSMDQFLSIYNDENNLFITFCSIMNNKYNFTLDENSFKNHIFIIDPILKLYWN